MKKIMGCLAIGLAVLSGDLRASSISLPDSESAILKDGKVIVANGAKGVAVVDLASGETVQSAILDGVVREIAESEDGLLAVSQRKTRATLSVLDENLAVLKRIETPFFRPGLVFGVRKGVAAVLNYNANKLLLVDLETEKSTVIDRPIQGLLYFRPNVAVRDNIIHLPGAYPGEVAMVDTTDLENPTITSAPVYDWIHNVVLVEESEAIVAGHLSGITRVSIEIDPEAPPFFVPEPEEHLSNLRAAQILGHEDKIIAIDYMELKVAVFNLSDGSKQTVELSPLSEKEGWEAFATPLGVFDGKVVSFESNGGLQLIDLNL